MTDPSHPSRDPAVRVAQGALATAYAQGLKCGSAAATADNPYFLCDRAMIAAAWEASCAGLVMRASRPLSEQEEYFVAWVHGYVFRAENIEDTLPT